MVDDRPLYQWISESVRQQILAGELKPGDRIPAIREMAEIWGCTPGTIQRAYQELVKQGLITSRVGQGTHVLKTTQPGNTAALRHAHLVHRSETFLLEILTAGYSPEEIEKGFHQALERWQVINLNPTLVSENHLRFAGSHDLVLTWLAAHFPEIVPTFSLDLGFTGSLGGLMALVTNQADLAGSHLWDEESDTYNVPFVQRLLPGKKTALVTLAHRHTGLLLPPGNPAGIARLKDLAKPGLRFINRQGGSGTRVWLDAALRRERISPESIQGYNDERMTHSEVAAAVADGSADAGFGLEALASIYGLSFVFCVRERYDLVIPENNLERTELSRLVDWLGSSEAHTAINSFIGYDSEETGAISWVGG